MRQDRSISPQNQVLLHLSCWLLFIANEQTAISGTIDSWGFLSRSIFYYACNITLFYLHLWMLEQTSGRRRLGYWLVGLFTLAELAAALLVKYAGNLFFNERLASAKIPYWRLGLLDLHRSLFFIGLATLIWSVRRNDGLRRRAAEAEQVRLQAERDKALLEVRLAEIQNAYYQHQLNPHLLFNTLSFIYNGVAGHSESAAKSVLLLADILRFCLRGVDPGGKIALDEEVQQIHNLLLINQLRFGDRLAVQLHSEGETSGRVIIPLILLTLVENVFKHALITDPDQPALIGLGLGDKGNLNLRVQNRKKRPGEDVSGGGLGIRNVRLRLANAYPDRYQLDIRETEHTYDLNLQISL